MSGLSNEMLLDVYGCAGEPQRWRQVLDKMCRDLGARSAVAQIFQRDGLRMRQRWTARDSFSLSHAEQHDAWVNNDENPRTDLTITHRPQEDIIVRDRDIFAAGCPHLARLRTRLSAIGLGQSVGINFPLGDKVSFSLILHRASDDASPFSQAEERLLRDLAPHLQQMLKLSAEREDSFVRLSTIEGAVNGMHAGVMICDVDRRVVWQNEAAAQIVNGSRYLGVVNGVLQCLAPTDEKKLRALIAFAAGTAASQSPRAVAALGGTEPDAVQIAAHRIDDCAPGTSPWFGPRERVVLLLSDMQRPPAFSAQDVAGLFNLSPAEAALAAALCAGRSVSDYALGRGISVGTARIQLKSILSKTNTRRQADLVRQICASVIAQTHALTH